MSQDKINHKAEGDTHVEEKEDSFHRDKASPVTKPRPMATQQEYMIFPREGTIAFKK